jgi:DNA-binding NtrC family response regulator
MDASFRGARATEVTVADLISGDSVFVENDGVTKLYVYDGTYLVELAEKKVTTNIAPETILSEESDDNWQMEEDPEEQDFTQDFKPEDMSIKTANLELIEKVLRKHDGNRKAAAAELGISERTLYRKLKQIK